MRYSQLKPAQLDGNVFGYHLKSLIAGKMVAKLPSGEYTLTSSGREYIVRRYETPVASAHSIFLIVLRRNGQYLLRRRKVMPLIGYAGFVHGEPTPGHGTTQAARERLYAKTGIDCLLVVQGSALITQYKEGELQSFSHAIILYGETSQDILMSSDATGENYWSKTLDEPGTLPSCHDIIAMVNKSANYLEKTYRL